MKRHSRGEEAFKGGRGIQGGKFFKTFFFQFFEILKSYIFVVIPGSRGVHRYPWFQNRLMNMARGEADTHTRTHTHTHELRFII